MSLDEAMRGRLIEVSDEGLSRVLNNTVHTSLCGAMISGVGITIIEE